MKHQPKERVDGRFTGKGNNGRVYTEMKGLETEWPWRQTPATCLTDSLRPLTGEKPRISCFHELIPNTRSEVQQEALEETQCVKGKASNNSANLQWDSLQVCHEVVIGPQRPWNHLDCGDIVPPRQGPGDRHCSTFRGDWENNSEIPFYTIISAKQKHLTIPCIDESVEKRNFHMWLTGVWVDVIMLGGNSEVTNEMHALHSHLENVNKLIN